jgi:large repetitive protein
VKKLSTPLLVLIPVALLAILLLLGFVGCTSTAPWTRYTDDTILLNAGSSGLVAYWTLEEPAGAPIAGDRSGNQHAGTYTSVPLTLGAQGIVQGDTVQPGDDPGFLTTSMEVAGGYVYVPYDAALNPLPSDGFTIDAWVRVGTIGGNSDRIVVISHDPNPGGNPGNGGFVLLANSSNLWEFRVGLGSTIFGSQVLTASPVVSASTTYHLVATYDSSDTLRLYVEDWDYGPISASPGYVPNGSNPLSIGARPNGTDPFVGQIQDVALYRGALSSIDVTKHFQNGNGQT